MTLGNAFLSVICMGVHCDDDSCACYTSHGCLYNALSKHKLAEIAKKRYAERYKQGRITAKTIEAMKVINENYPDRAKVV